MITLAYCLLFCCKSIKKIPICFPISYNSL